MLDWKKEPELVGTSVILLTRRRFEYQEDAEYEYSLLMLFRLSEDSSWSVDGPLASMSADNFNPQDYDGFVLVEHNGKQQHAKSPTKDQGV